MNKWKSKFSSLLGSFKKANKESSSSEEVVKESEELMSENSQENPDQLLDSSEEHGDDSLDDQTLFPTINTDDATHSSYQTEQSEDDSDEENQDNSQHEYDDENQENTEDESLDFEQDTNPSFSTLTIDNIKQSQVENGEIPPELPVEIEDAFAQEDDHSFSDENDFEITNPAIREFTPQHKHPTISKLFTGKFDRSALSQTKIKEKILDQLSQIHFDEYFEKLYAPQNRKNIHFAFLALMLMGLSIKSAQIISNLLTPFPSTAKRPLLTPASLNQLDSIKNSLAQLENNDLFRVPRKGNIPDRVAPDHKEEAICLDAKKKSSLNIKLLSTVVLQDEVKSLASVQRRKDSEYLRKGDSIDGVLEVGRIASQRLFFKNLKTRECEYIENTPKESGQKSNISLIREPKKIKKALANIEKNGISNVGNQFKIKKEVRARMLENISEVLTQARAVQVKNPDGSLAFRMQEVVPGSIYSQLNIENGDVITGINGSKIKNVSELMQLFGQIDKLDHLELSVKKKGIEQDLSYDFE